MFCRQANKIQALSKSIEDAGAMEIERTGSLASLYQHHTKLMITVMLGHLTIVSSLSIVIITFSFTCPVGAVYVVVAAFVSSDVRFVA